MALPLHAVWRVQPFPTHGVSAMVGDSLLRANGALVTVLTAQDTVLCPEHEPYGLPAVSLLSVT